MAHESWPNSGRGMLAYAHTPVLYLALLSKHLVSIVMGFGMLGLAQCCSVRVLLCLLTTLWVLTPWQLFLLLKLFMCSMYNGNVLFLFLKLFIYSTYNRKHFWWIEAWVWLHISARYCNTWYNWLPLRETSLNCLATSALCEASILFILLLIPLLPWCHRDCLGDYVCLSERWEREREISDCVLASIPGLLPPGTKSGVVAYASV